MYLLIGGSGFLGRYIIKNVLNLTTEKVVATYNSSVPQFLHPRLKWVQYNVQTAPSELTEQLTNDNEPISVVYLAAYHHPDKVQKNFKKAWDINIVSLARIINNLNNVKCFFYTSTDSVYGDGNLNEKFTENSHRSPVNLYGRQKKIAEDIVLGYGYNVVRFPFIIGPSLVEKKDHFFDIIVNRLKNQEVIELFDDSYRSTLSFDQGANYLVQLIELFDKKKIPQVLNISSDSPLSKYQVGLQIAKDLSLDTKFISPIKQAEQNTIFEARRPLVTLLDNQLLKSTLGIENIVYKVK